MCRSGHTAPGISTAHEEDMMRVASPSLWPWTVGIAIPAALFVASPFVVVTDLQLPGTQPLEVAPLNAATQCDNCHGGFDPDSEPARPWRGSMMAQAGRDPLFWATMAIAEQDFPDSGDLCLRCHAPRGWFEGRSTPTDGSGLLAADEDGVECAICHQLTDQDGQEHPGVQLAPFIANDGGTPPEGFYGSGTMVLAAGNTRYGPYGSTAASHSYAGSLFHRDSALCGTCHDVSNPVTGDLAHNHGAQIPLPAGRFSGVPNSPVTGKAAFLNPPYRYGVTERTFSEHQSSAFATLPVRDYATLPAELQRGPLEASYERALLAGRQGDYADGATRLFSCQTCHMMPIVGKGARQNAAPVRTDIPTHFTAGGNTWVPELIKWADTNNRLLLGAGLDAVQIAALDAGIEHARANLTAAAGLDIHGDVLHVVNLTGHKLISGYPEGRRMWLRVRWRDRQGNVVRTDGDYGPITAQVNGSAVSVDSLTDLDDPNLTIYQAEHGITQEWASQLIGLGWPATQAVDFERTTGAVTRTLGQVAAQPPGTASPSFHFVLNNTMLHDTRIPPYGMDYDAARQRNILPVPATSYGDPGPGGRYRHWDEVPMQPPPGAASAEIDLLYQSTSWEYVQFLMLANSSQNAFLGTAGRDLYDGWRATGMSPPEVMVSTRWCRLPGTGEDLELTSAIGTEPPNTNCAKTITSGDTVQLRLATPGGTFVGQLAAFVFEFYGDRGPMPSQLLPGLQIDRIDGQVVIPALPAGGGSAMSITFPAGLGGIALRCQGVVVSVSARNSTYAASPAHDLILQ
ncbi:MAG: hypothetical protein KDC98_24130 [Planctomycetes bacterium]|nr:hypothetical protein [Planctomycetota bacterium]